MLILLAVMANSSLLGAIQDASATSTLGSKQRTEFLHNQGVNAVAFSPDCRLLAAGCEMGKVYLWDVHTHKQVRELAGHRFGVKAVAFSPDGRWLASGSWDDTVRLWEVATGRELGTCIGHRSGVSAVAISPDGRLLASASSDCCIRLWDPKTARESRCLGPCDSAMITVAFSPDGSTLAGAGRSGVIALYDVATGKESRRIETKESTICSIAFAPDGGTLASGGASGAVHFWDVATGMPLTRAANFSDRKFGSSIMEVAFSPDGLTVAAANESGSIQMWETVSGLPIEEVGRHDQKAKAVAFAANGKALASGGNDGRAFLWTDSESSPSGETRQAPLASANLQRYWDDLASADAAKGQTAVRRLAAAGEQALRFMQPRLLPKGAVDARQVARWIAELDDDKYLIRQQAFKALQDLGRAAQPALSRAFQASPSLEARLRLQQLLEWMGDAVLSPDQLRSARAVIVLERIATPEARLLLEKLATNDPNARSASLARTAIKRLAMQAPPGQ